MEKKLIKQIGKFASVGVINTLVDLAVLNFLVLVFSFNLTVNVLGLSFLVANVVSVTIAMIGSYFLNKYWTFEAKEKDRNLLQETLKFILITVIGMFVIHQIVFNLFLVWWTWPVDLAKTIAHFVGIRSLDNFITLNFAKVLAILASMVWNFIGYKLWVFKEK